MDTGLLQELISRNKPFRIETASGRAFDVPHRDFVSFSLKRTSLYINYGEDGKERQALVPLLTITSATSEPPVLS